MRRPLDIIRKICLHHLPRSRPPKGVVRFSVPGDAGGERRLRRGSSNRTRASGGFRKRRRGLRKKRMPPRGHYDPSGCLAPGGREPHGAALCGRRNGSGLSRRGALPVRLLVEARDAIKPKIAAHGRRVTGSKKLGSVTRRHRITVAHRISEAIIEYAQLPHFLDVLGRKGYHYRSAYITRYHAI